MSSGCDAVKGHPIPSKLSVFQVVLEAKNMPEDSIQSWNKMIFHQKLNKTLQTDP